jgi:putative transposase
MQRGAAVRTQSRTSSSSSQAKRTVRVGDVSVDPHSALMELVVSTGLQVVAAMLEEDRTALCGRRYQHQPQRAAGRAGTTASEVVLGGR